MAKQTINIGSSADDGTGTTIRAGGDLINDNFNEIYTELGDGSTVAFTVTNGMTVNNTLVFINGVFQRPTTDYAISGTTLTFGTAPVAADVITIKEL